jgi:hypothetical protein
MDKAIRKAMVGESVSGSNVPGVQVMLFRAGRMITGPYIVKSVNWNFSIGPGKIDEYGFPIEGSVTLGDIESIYFPITELINIYDNPI